MGNHLTDAVIANYAYREIRTRHGYSSSAQNLDELLKINGIETKFRFARNYKLPNCISPEEYEKKILRFLFCKSVTDGVDDCLDEKRFPGVKEYIIQSFPSFLKEMEAETQWICAHNPELSNIDISHGNISFLRGVCYKFAPEDITWFLDKKSIKVSGDDEAAGELSDFMRRENMLLSYRLCPEHQKKLYDLVVEARCLESSLSVAAKKQQMLDSYVAVCQQLDNGYYSPIEVLEDWLKEQNLIEKPIFTHSYKLPEGYDLSKLGRVLDEISFYQEIKRADTVLLQSKAPQKLLQEVRGSFMEEMPRKMNLWNNIFESVLALNPELSEIKCDNPRLLLESVYFKMPLQEIDWALNGSLNEKNFKDFKELMWQKGFGLQYVPCPETQEKLQKMFKDDQIFSCFPLKAKGGR